MAVNWPTDAPWFPVPGIRLASAAAGIRYPGRDDVVLFALAPGTTVAALFTRNAFCAAPVHLSRRHLAEDGEISALLINSGNANAGTGTAGMRAAESCCDLVAQALCLTDARQVLPFSTGVIGEALPVAPYKSAMAGLSAGLSENAWPQAAKAIMTTDTCPKLRSRHCELPDGRRITLTGMAKGAGMIKPDMATMLAFVATDAPMEEQACSEFLSRANSGSFNAITVDGDTSTNDAVVLMASGQAGGAPLKLDSPAGRAFQATLSELMQELAQGIVRDAEGATRFIEVEVGQAESVSAARQVAYTIAESPLVKTAAFAGDPNWGRILAAIGRSGLPDLDVDAVSLWLDEVCLIRDGQPNPDYREADGAAVAQQAEFSIRVELGRGEQSARIWTSDFSYDYVRINAEYRS